MNGEVSTVREEGLTSTFLVRYSIFSTSQKRSRRLVSLRLIDAEIAEKGHLWMDSSLTLSKTVSFEQYQVPLRAGGSGKSISLDISSQ